MSCREAVSGNGAYCKNQDIVQLLLSLIHIWLCDQLDADEPLLQTVLDIARLKGKVQQMVNITDKMEIRP